MSSTIASDRERMRIDFANRLPSDLGKPYIMNTFDAPVTFVAFYPAQKHEIADGRVINGSEIRLLTYGTGLKSQRMLAAIIGLDETNYQVVLLALRCQGTKHADIKPYERMILEMLAEATMEVQQKGAQP